MSLEFMDNFSNYGTGSLSDNRMLEGVYAQVTTTCQCVADPDGVSGGAVIRVITGTVRKVLSAAQTTVGVALRLWITELPSLSSNSPRFLTFADAANAVQVGMWIETTGVLTVRLGTSYSGTLLGQTTTPAITAGAWNHIETKVLFSQTVGTLEVRVNGVPVIEETGLDTCNTSNVECSQIRLATADSAGLSGADDFYIKDLYIWNGGGSVYNDFVGDVQIVTLRPDTDVSLNWTCSTGTDGSNLIDETTPDDTDYISATDPPPAAFVCELTDLDDEVVSVKGLMIFNRMLKTDGGAATIQSSMVSNGDDGPGADRNITVAATYWMDAVELDPDTASAWTPVSVNNARLKINRTT